MNRNTQMQGHILLVDDEQAFCELCSLWLTQKGYSVKTCGNMQAALALFEQERFDLVVHDLALPPTFRPEDTVAELIRYGDTPVVVLTGHNEKSLALDAIRNGAWDFLTKPIDPDFLNVVVARAIERQRLANEVRVLNARVEQENYTDTLGLVGNSKATQSLRELIRRIAPTDVSVLIQGPSGTGKELIASALHRLSLRKEKPFISVHCGAIPGDLLESELFGYKQGAFTGADRDRKGLLKMADGGTLFLDEIGEMPLAMQVKLLRVLQEGSYYPVGSRQMEHIDIRVISATNRDIPTAIEEGVFRDDLYYRIKGLTVATQPLQQRPEDIPILVRAFLERYGTQHDRQIQLDPAAAHWFSQQIWPGNVRELRNVIESAAAVCQNNALSIADLMLVTGSSTVPADKDTPPRQIDLNHTLDTQVKELEIALIKMALEAQGGNKTRAAEQLGLTRQGLQNKILRYNLQ
ncbi:MAG: sigma-54 dependent transcriptional regulator [Pseudomonadales bacterium]|nr:sigma-54 dependent transcriptional regulator [Pseudomonadales bacterium]